MLLLLFFSTFMILVNVLGGPPGHKPNGGAKMVSIHSLSELERLKLQEAAYEELLARRFLSEFRPERGEQGRGVESSLWSEWTPLPPSRHRRERKSWGFRRVGGAPASFRTCSVLQDPGKLSKWKLQAFELRRSKRLVAPSHKLGRECV